jgi:hypothetical protein
MYGGNCNHSVIVHFSYLWMHVRTLFLHLLRVHLGGFQLRLRLQLLEQFPLKPCQMGQMEKEDEGLVWNRA